MKRVDRLQPVQKIVDDNERRLAEHFAAAERLLSGCEQKLKELENYRNDYTHGFSQRAGGGIGARQLVDYQAFMSRLNEAIKQQAQVTQQARHEREVQFKRWQDAARRAKALNHVMHNWQQEELRVLNKREQRDSDERAQRRRVTPHER